MGLSLTVPTLQLAHHQYHFIIFLLFVILQSSFFKVLILQCLLCTMHYPGSWEQRDDAVIQDARLQRVRILERRYCTLPFHERFPALSCVVPNAVHPVRCSRLVPIV